MLVVLGMYIVSFVMEREKKEKKKEIECSWLLFIKNNIFMEKIKIRG